MSMVTSAAARALPDSPAGPVEALCREHGYPPEVQAVLQRVIDLLQPLEPLSVFLHGSTARGELSWWREPDGRVRIASDVEAYVVGEGPFPAEGKERAEEGFRVLADEVNAGGPALFHVDVAFTTPARLAGHDRTFRCWDTRETGRALAGRDARGWLPELGVGDLDLRQLNEVPIHRLWEMVFRAPRAVVEGRAGAADEQAFSYVCARQALDLTTWLLPHLGVLVPTFRRRVDAWGRELAHPPLAKYFPPHSAAFLAECLKGKLRQEFDRPGAALHAEVLEHFRAALRLLLALDPAADDAEVARAMLRQGRRHWHGEPPRRRLFEAYLLVRDRRLLHPVRSARWWALQKRPRQLVFLLHMNAALQAILAGGDADGPLSAAEGALARLSYRWKAEPGAPAARFLAARRGYVDYMVDTSRWFAPRADYLYSVIE